MKKLLFFILVPIIIFSFYKLWSRHYVNKWPMDGSRVLPSNEIINKYGFKKAKDTFSEWSSLANKSIVYDGNKRLAQKLNDAYTSSKHDESSDGVILHSLNKGGSTLYLWHGDYGTRIQSLELNEKGIVVNYYRKYDPNNIKGYVINWNDHFHATSGTF